MAFEADIIVTSGDGSEFMMVVETKWHEQDLSKAEAQLKAYMRSVRSPVGLLVTPNQLRIFRDRCLPSPHISVEEVGRFDVSELFGPYPKDAGRNDALRFENEVQSWLESLSAHNVIDQLPAELRSAAESTIVPVLSQGVIRAGHPRSVLSA
jgi:hypothetical protein